MLGAANSTGYASRLQLALPPYKVQSERYALMGHSPEMSESGRYERELVENPASCIGSQDCRSVKIKCSSSWRW